MIEFQFDSCVRFTVLFCSLFKEQIVMSASIYEKIENQLLQLVEGGSVKALVQIRQKNFMWSSKISFFLGISIISWHKLIHKKLAKISEIKEDLEQAFQYYRKEFYF